MKNSLTILAAAACLALGGCASIISSGTQVVTFSGKPEGAKITVTNSAGVDVHTATTPATVTLNRGAGYFKSEAYVVRLEKEGFEPKEIPVTATVNGWYVGNLVFGGLIGFLLIDPLTGAMYALPDTVDVSMLAKGAPKAAAAVGSLTVMSTQDMPPQVMQEARLVAAF
jgi:hypothetical protein